MWTTVRHAVNLGCALGTIAAACLAQDVMTRPADVPSSANQTQMRYAARIVMEDGTTPPVELQVRSAGYCYISGVFRNGTVTFQLPRQPITEHTYRPASCQVWVMAPGMRSQYVTITDGSQIALKRLGEHEGSTISMTILKAPPEAKKAYAKGAEAMLKQKFAEARKQFEEAARIYPEYALAWSELGAALVKVGDIDAARAALHKAIACDDMYIKPLVQLAELEAWRMSWPDVIQASEQAMKLNAIEFPGAYYYRALAHLRDGEWDRAVALSRKAVSLDARQEYPRAYLVMGSALEKRGDKQAAVEALESYLAMRPSAGDAEQARAYLKRLESQP